MVGLGERCPVSCSLGSRESNVVQPVLLERRAGGAQSALLRSKGRVLGLKKPTAKPQGPLEESRADLTSLPGTLAPRDPT